MDVAYREAEIGDSNRIKELEIVCGLSPWAIDDYKNAISSPSYMVVVGGFDERLVCFLLARIDAGNESGGLMEIMNIAVDDDFRRRGIGRALIDNAVERCGLTEGAIELEVRQGNEAALNLYLGSGFRIVGRRPGFYSNPSEDAVLMTRSL